MGNFIGLSLSTLLGAFFGALFAYWFALHQRKQESVARCAELLKLLSSELRAIGGQLTPYDVAKAIYRDPIRLSAPGNLLDGNTLTYKANAALIQTLQQFQVAVSKYNDFVHVTNQAQAVCAVPDHIHQQWFAEIAAHNQNVITSRDQLLGHLGTASNNSLQVRRP